MDDSDIGKLLDTTNVSSVDVLCNELVDENTPVIIVLDTANPDSSLINSNVLLENINYVNDNVRIYETLIDYDNPVPGPSGDFIMKYVCRHCDRVYSSRDSWRRHTISSHGFGKHDLPTPKIINFQNQTQIITDPQHRPQPQKITDLRSQHQPITQIINH